MADPKVEPALSRRQWEKLSSEAELWDPSTAHVDMALANVKLPDGDRRKFSRVQAVNIRAAAVCLESGLLPGPETRTQLAGVLRATASAIEAILPPPATQKAAREDRAPKEEKGKRRVARGRTKGEPSDGNWELGSGS